MGLFEVNNYYNEEATKGVWDYAQTYVGIVIGFGLTTITSWYLRVSERKKIGEQYTYNLTSFKKPMGDVINSIDEFVVEFEKGNIKNILIYRASRFEFLKYLDKSTLVKYWSKHKNFKNELNPTEKATHRVANVFFSIDSYAEELKRLEKFCSDYDTLEKNMVKTFKTNLDVLRRYFASYADGISYDERDEIEKDVMFSGFIKLEEQYIKDQTITRNYILNLKSSYLKKLMEFPFDDSNNPHYKQIFPFTTEARDLILHYEAETNIFIKQLGIISKNLRDAYKNIFEEEYLKK